VAQQHGEARNKDDVMHAASQLAANIRLQLSGNSANSPGNTPAPLPTASLPAYQAYVVGGRLYETQLKQSAAMLRRATQLDPSFVEAWDLLSLADYNLFETKRSVEDVKHTFALREKLSANEKAGIEARYYREVTGELYRAIDALQTWEKLQPNDFAPRNQLGLVYADLGMYEKATIELQKNTDLFPRLPHAITILSVILRAQGRYDEAEALFRQIPADQAVGFFDHRARYEVAMLRSDRASLERERSWMEQNSDEPATWCEHSGRFWLVRGGGWHVARSRARRSCVRSRFRRQASPQPGAPVVRFKGNQTRRSQSDDPERPASRGAKDHQ
jgi:tetratricopeptide (TPR) repeat protein